MSTTPYITYPLSLHDALPITDAMTVWMSPQVEAITGYRADEWVGKRGFFESILFADDRASVLEEVRASRDELRPLDRKSTRLNSSHVSISYAVFCWKKKMSHY